MCSYCQANRLRSASQALAKCNTASKSKLNTRGVTLSQSKYSEQIHNKRKKMNAMALFKAYTFESENYSQDSQNSQQHSTKLNDQFIFTRYKISMQVGTKL